MSTARAYVELKLELRDLDLAAKTFKVAVLPSDVGDAGGLPAVSVPYAIDGLDAALFDIERKRIGIEDLTALGRQLAARLLPAGVLELYQQALDKAGRDGGVRLRLIIRAQKLAQIPWEYTYLQAHDGAADPDFFLARNPQISIVRHESLPDSPPPLAARDPQHLRLVVVMANATGMPVLKLDQEQKVIRGALSNFNVDGVSIDWEPILNDTTPSDLTDALRKGADLFHFAGHGLFQEEDIDPDTQTPIGEGKLVLLVDKESKKRFLLRGRELATELQAAGVRLAVLGACQSARKDDLSPWSGIAPALLEKGMAAAVAMQFSVRDDAALAFSQSFYKALAAGLTLDEAVAGGRRAMAQLSSIASDRNCEWGIPALYMRSVDGVIFKALSARPSPTADQLRADINKHVYSIVQKVRLVGASGNLVGFEAQGKGAVVDRDVHVDQTIDTLDGNATGVKLDEL